MIKIIESKALNEGPGAGYTIKGTIENVKVNKVVITGRTKDKDIMLKVDATADLKDVSCQSYMYGGEIESTPIHIFDVHVESYGDDEDLYTPQEVAGIIDGTKIDVVYGGGWSHATFDGEIMADYNDFDNSHYMTYIGFEFTNKNAIEFVDSAVQLPDEYFGLVDEDGVIEDAYEDEEKAVELAKKHGYDKVVRFYEYRTYLYADNESEDTDEEIIETVWEREDESLKESKGNKHITKVPTKKDNKKELKESYVEVDTIVDDNGTEYRVVGGGFNSNDALVPVEDKDGKRKRMSSGDVAEFYTWKDSKGKVIHEPAEMDESKENCDNNKKCLNKKCDKKELNETFAGEDVISDLVDRAKGWIRDGSDIEEAIETSIDDGLIYTEDIINLAEHYGYFDADRSSEMISFFYDDLRSDMEEKLKETNDDDVDESLKKLDEFGIVNLFKK